MLTDFVTCIVQKNLEKRPLSELQDDDTSTLSEVGQTAAKSAGTTMVAISTTRRNMAWAHKAKDLLSTSYNITVNGTTYAAACMRQVPCP
jgi:hypothetical protein